jgi:hypothetical protein
MNENSTRKLGLFNFIFYFIFDKVGSNLFETSRNQFGPFLFDQNPFIITVSPSLMVRSVPSLGYFIGFFSTGKF